MTISYTGDVANASRFGIFVKILYKWKGSVYKLVYKELLAYILAYFVINITYRAVIVKYSEDCDRELPSCIRSEPCKIVANCSWYRNHATSSHCFLWLCFGTNHHQLCNVLTI